MLVLSIIGIIVGLFLFFVFISYVNAHSVRVYSYEIFNGGNFSASIAGYLAIFFGNNWYTDALSAHEDTLNGQLVIGIGIILLLAMVYVNIKNTSLIYGLIMSIISEALYLAATPFVLLTLVLIFAFFAETKPVYVIND